MMATARKEVAVETTRPRVFKEPVIVMMDGVMTSVMRNRCGGIDNGCDHGKCKREKCDCEDRWAGNVCDDKID